MALVTLDDNLKRELEEFVSQNHVDFPTMSHYLNQLVKQDLKKRNVVVVSLKEKQNFNAKEGKNDETKNKMQIL